MEPIVIVGSGLAAYQTARELRKLDKAVPLTLITADGGEFYSKPTLSNAIAAGKAPAAIAVNSAEQMATQLGAVVRTRTRVTALEPGAHRISTGDEQLSYSRLVLATGAGQIRLDLAGEGAADVRWVNSLDDYAAFRTAVAGKRRIAIIGAGLIGCEFANDLALGGYEVAVIDIAGQPLPRLLPPAGGTMLREKLAALGIAWHFGVSVTRVEREAGRLAITLSDTSVLEADVVLSAVGLRPDTALARAAGAAVNFGIVTNRNLETSLPDVYALGDCAEVEGLVLPFVMPIMHAARALASTLAGKPAALSYPAMPVLVKTPACPTIVSPPARDAVGEWHSEEIEGGIRSTYLDRSGKLLGFALNGTATAERAKLAPQLPPVLP
jgi:rubredoxin---NAD+ reductase